jgi:aminopeptidase N
MGQEEVQEHYLKDYQPSAFIIEEAALVFHLDVRRTRVQGEYQVKRNSKSKDNSTTLSLDGEQMELLSIQIDGQDLATESYQQHPDRLEIFSVADSFVLTLEVVINPQENKALSGLYLSQGQYCTQCESQGFRRIIYFLDRPDVMAKFKTKIIAPKDKFTALLSNGNLLADRINVDGFQEVEWEDPFPKPSYLFALVAGQFDELEDTFITMHKRKVKLYIYVDRGRRHQGEFALDCLKRAMEWDERAYGRECDLDRYSIVAIHDFNYGAMENKGLNVFNSRYVLADPKTATDQDYMLVDTVIAHEYFHNWSGNRVTLRDWFQISIKEGLTVFREQSYAEEQYGVLTQRIAAVNRLKTIQFAEDAGPLSHPVQPKSYKKIDNFYTATVYEKGAEVVRMLSVLLGAKNFRKAMDHYFSTYDGQAVTKDDFLAVMENTSGMDLSSFVHWYDIAGTPKVDISAEYQAEQGIYTLQVQQSCSQSKQLQQARPIPIRIGLLSVKGERLSFSYNGKTQDEVVLLCDQLQQSFSFKVATAPIPSLFRHFSAPVHWSFDFDSKDLQVLLQHDSDHFNRWEASRSLQIRAVKDICEKPSAVESEALQQWLSAIRNLFVDLQSNTELLTQILSWPSLTFLLQCIPEHSLDDLHRALGIVKERVAQDLKAIFAQVFSDLSNTRKKYQFKPSLCLQRSLTWQLLGYLYLNDPEQYDKQAETLYAQVDNMTDQQGILWAINNKKSRLRDQLLEKFYQQWKHEELVIDVWFRMQVLSNRDNVAAEVYALAEHPRFCLDNPNRVRALLGSFAAGNLLAFHKSDGESYRFLTRYILSIDSKNPQLAAGLSRSFAQWKRFDRFRQKLIRQQLEVIQQHPKLSPQLKEVVAKILA